MAAHASAESDDFQKYYYFLWWECGFLDMQNSDFQKSCISIGGRAISEIAKTVIFTIWLLSSGGKATSEMCKTVILENHCISIGGRAISEIAKTASFTNWLLSSGGKTIFEVWTRSIVEKGYFPDGKVASGHCPRCTQGVCGRDVRA